MTTMENIDFDKDSVWICGVPIAWAKLHTVLKQVCGINRTTGLFYNLNYTINDIQISFMTKFSWSNWQNYSIW